ncbi:hypothetical protein ACTJJ0_26890 [Chitinophaga sp. 22321]|uniref:DUF4386 family protein n=1 Tax=Chitinophaga hostae TaxID=2831022 RepID=A0ABS5J690_9BACT|nr:hypothetical protein [Chitinophaga hostae]MBS0030739.1 hypothetical protein [Chitinophaga hostae]
MNYRLSIGVTCLISVVFSIACLAAGAVAVDYNFDAFSDPRLVLRYSAKYHTAYWFNILDMFGYYLLLIPLVMYYHQQYKFRSPWTALITFSGLAYTLIGAIGAVTLAVSWRFLMQQYTDAGGNLEEVTEVVFLNITLIITKGYWNMLEAVFAAIWFAGIGRLLYNENKAVGITGVITGIATLLDATGNIFDVKILAETGLNVYLVSSIVFVLMLGVKLIKTSRQHHVGK